MFIKFYFSATELVNDEPRFAFDAVDYRKRDDRMILIAKNGDKVSINLREVFAYRVVKDC